jgi:hypothetical protein
LRRSIAAMGALVGTALGAAVANAQELRAPEGRQGYYLGASIRTGFSGPSTDEVDGIGSFGMFGGSFRFSEMALPWLGLGGVAQFYRGSNDAFDALAVSGAIEAQFEPWPSRNLAFRVASGPILQEFVRQDPSRSPDDEPERGWGVLLSTGASYDLFPFRRDPLRSGGWSAGLYLEGQGWFSENFTSFGVFAGLEIGHFFGLSRSKLDLPAEEAYR